MSTYGSFYYRTVIVCGGVGGICVCLSLYKNSLSGCLGAANDLPHCVNQCTQIMAIVAQC